MALNSYNTRRRVYVTPFPGVIRYGFLTNVPDAVGVTCGHTVAPADGLAGLVFGANSPKPGRASIRRTGGVDSTFYDFSRYGALRAAGASLTNPRRRRGSASALSQAVFVTINGFKYAWRIPQTQLTKIAGDAAALGLQIATAADDDLVFGVNSPKPPRASKVVVSADGVDTISTFIDPSRVDSLPDGWSTSNGEQVQLGAGGAP